MRERVIRFGVVAKRVASRREGSGRISGEQVEAPQVGPWRGFTVVCIASGPSLTEADAEAVRVWRNAGEGRRVVVTNNTYQLCPWADVLAAMDRKWWEVHGADARQFAGEKFAVGSIHGVRQMTAPHFGFSGAMAIAFAAGRGASRIILLGYDCQRTGGKAHWHGDHDRRLGNAGSLGKWAEKAGRLARAPIMRGVEVINATRETALKCWPRESLEKALAHSDAQHVGSGANSGMDREARRASG